MERKIRAVVVDDEGSTRTQLSGFLSAEPDIEIVGICNAGREAIPLLKRANPDAVFLAPQLPDTGGFDVLAALDPQDLPLVVFVTAHGEYAARAFELGAVDYLVKPFDSKRFGVALARVRKGLRWGTGGSGKGVLPRAKGRYLDRIMVKDRGRVYLVRTLDIDWIESADNYVRIHVAKDIHLIRGSLKHLGPCLDAGRFARIHRCTIVNLDRVREIQPGVGREHIVILKDGTRLKLGHRYRRYLEKQTEPGW